MSIVVAAPVAASISKSFFAKLWTAISYFPFGVATIPFRLNWPGTCTYWPPRSTVVSSPGIPFREIAIR